MKISRLECFRVPPRWLFVRVESESLKTPAGRTAGFIAFNVWMTAVDAPFQDAVDRFRTADGIIVDLRGNPGGLAAMLMGISGHFFSERTSLGVMKTRDNELRFTANPRLVSARGERVPPYAGSVAILVDSMSGSASECFTGGMQSLGRASHAALGEQGIERHEEVEVEAGERGLVGHVVVFLRWGRDASFYQRGRSSP